MLLIGCFIYIQHIYVQYMMGGDLSLIRQRISTPFSLSSIDRLWMGYTGTGREHTLLSGWRPFACVVALALSLWRNGPPRCRASVNTKFFSLQRSASEAGVGSSTGWAMR
ncbi:hypothetical protein CISG_05592 [Coccidioides immitis RMSCC 3703]|uniref:Uncharacterized protein n=1 Tax=Coccidioides immitis RMSCC 3703 TaxID=454286 RepID=A0A0J8QTL3_COCIT|nr:hypothetical protein CISG_05592 [Coccidioides immitis RMSCC 3703]